MEKKKIICDKCGEEIGRMNLLKDRVIAKDRAGAAVTERFFECPACRTHYTVTVTDREMRLMIQKREQLMKKVNSLLRVGGSKERMQQLLDADEKLKEDLKSRADRLKGEYAGGDRVRHERGGCRRNGAAISEGMHNVIRCRERR